MIRSAPIALVCVMATLSGLVYWEARPGARQNAPLRTPPRAAASPASNADRGPTDAALQSWSATILARPLFSPSRRPAIGNVLAATPAAALPRLSGVLVSASGKLAIFAGPAGKPAILQVGDRLGRFVVRAISDGEVTLDGPGGRQLLHPAFASDRPSQTGARPEPEPATILGRLRTGQPPKIPVPPAPTVQSLLHHTG
jgi:hypothetical protein